VAPLARRFTLLQALQFGRKQRAKSFNQIRRC
jgi:hypothetical protein